MSDFLSHFHFLRPEWLLLIIPALIVAGYLLSSTLRRGQWEDIIDPELQQHMLDQTPRKSSSAASWGVIFSWIIAAVAIAGPSWERKSVPVVSNPDALVIILDMSLSMNATDVAPDRATRAVRKATDIVRGREDGITAVIAYSGDAHTVVPFTDDKATVEHLLTALSPEIMPKLGSRPDRALIQATTLMQDAGVNEATALLITDGIQSRDVERISSVLPPDLTLALIAVGTSEGAPVPIGEQGFLKKDDGTIVLPRLDTEPMQELYDATGSRWRHLSYDDSDWRSLINTGARGADDNEQKTTFETWQDAGYWLTLLLIPAALLSFRRGVLFSVLLLIIILPDQAFAGVWQTENQKAAELMNTDPAQAAELFTDPEWQGTAHYRAGNYDAAIEAFSRSDSARASFNKGNALANTGKLEDAISAYEEALQKQPDFPEAQQNLNAVEEALKQQEQQNQQGDSDSENGDNSQNSDNSQGQNGDSNSEQNNSQNNDQSNGQDASQNSSGNSSGSDSSQSSDSQPDNADAQNKATDAEEQAQKNADNQYAQQQAEKQADQQNEQKQSAQNASSDEDGSEEQSAMSQSEQDKPADEDNAQQDQQSQSEGAGIKQNPANEAGDELNDRYSSMSREEQAAMESVLNEVEDNPGLLMQRKFLYQYRQNADQSEEDVLW